jgi:hypothetical protein
MGKAKLGHMAKFYYSVGMTNLHQTDDLFFNQTGMNRTVVEGLVDTALHGADDGELFLEYAQSGLG